MSRPTLAVIHRSALRRNLARARRANPQARMLPVIKANGYGHGMVDIARAAAAAQADYLGVARAVPAPRTRDPVARAQPGKNVFLRSE